jgi:tetratricopeptide (TPR) repeat protein
MPTVGLCVIAKNAASTLEACLRSVKGLVAAVVLVDTGSTDRTAEVARENGAKVVAFPWNGDFSAARNAALAAVSTDWILVLDADEELDQAASAWIRQELKAPRVDGYVVPVRNYLKPWAQPLIDHHALPSAERHPRAPDVTSYMHSEVCRLYRRDPDIYYVGHVHEQVEYRMMQLGRPIGRAGFFIHHFGWYLIDEEGLLRKHKLYGELLAKKAQERPDDPQALLQYGDALCAWSGKVEEGLALFMKAAALRGCDPTIWAYIASALLQLNQMDAALIAVEQIPAGDEYAGKRAQIKGEVLGACKRWEEACVAYREALEHFPDNLDVQKKLALLEMETGNREQGIARMRAAIAVAERQALAHGHAHLFLCAAELCAQIKQWPDALRLANAGLMRNASLLPVRELPFQELRLRAAVATGQPAEAAEAAARISEHAPSPRAILRHAAILNQSGNLSAACRVIAFGLKQFPMSDELKQVQRELGAMTADALA